MEPTRDAILAALAGVIDPELQRPVTELDMVRDIEVEDGVVSLTIVLTIAGCPLRDSFERQALTTKLRGGVERDSVVKLPEDCRVIAVASGKGGVGKSSLTANLAV